MVGTRHGIIEAVVVAGIYYNTRCNCGGYYDVTAAVVVVGITTIANAVAVGTVCRQWWVCE